LAGGAGDVGIGDVVGVGLALDDVAAALELVEVVHAVASTPKASSAATITVRFRMFPPGRRFAGCLRAGEVTRFVNR